MCQGGGREVGVNGLDPRGERGGRGEGPPEKRDKNKVCLFPSRHPSM